MTRKGTSDARGRAGRPAARKSVNLALQGGGAHGAFAWGVLDRLLEDGRLAFEGVTAASAGAMNAVVLAHGLSLGGAAAAREALAEFWWQVSRSALLSPLQPSWFDRLRGVHGATTPAHFFFETLVRVVSPYQFNPFNINPLRDVLADLVDFDRLRRDCAVKLHVSATNVRSGKIKIFTGEAISLDAVMASACLPFVFQAVEIDGEAYWDGGYMGNPAIFPLIYHCHSRDVVIVHINPLYRDEVPRDAMGIFDRINEISFNSSLMREMRTIAFVTDLIDRQQLAGRSMKRMLIHAIEEEKVMRTLSHHSKLSPDWRFLTELRDLGRHCAAHWLEENFEALGQRSTVDLRETYL